MCPILDSQKPMPIIAATWSLATGGCQGAIAPLIAGGSALDAVCAVARTAERDSTVDSVGLGGLPDATGHVTLDACVMVSPAKCGAVCAVAKHLDVTDLARMVMERTRHVMLAGKGADDFARALGMRESNLLAPRARAAWERWRTGGETPPSHDTVGVLAIDGAGVMAGACSTSGMAYKLAGRVGDSPIPGHGLYVDPEVGGAVATGNGELVMGVCGTFLAVEAMRRGSTPQEAVAEVLERIERTYSPEPHQQVGVIVLSRDGRIGSGALRGGFEVVVADEQGVRLSPAAMVTHPDTPEVKR